MRRDNHLAAVPLICLLLVPLPLWAYLDPSSGSIMLQMAVGGLLAALAVVRVYWRKIRSVLGLGRKREDMSEQ